MKKKEKKINLCHLIGFKLLSKEEAQIDERFRIRRLLPRELLIPESIYEKNRPSFFDWESFEFCIENNEEIRLDSLLSDLNRIIIAMWLFRGCSVTKGVLLLLPRRIDQVFYTIEDFRCWQGRGIWQAKDSEIIRFNEFWNIMKKLHLDLKDIGINYFKKAMGSRGFIDSLINLTIAMECILLPNEGQEKSYKFSSRAAYILAKKYEERDRIKELFKNAYTQRSNIVHGGKLNYKKFNKESFLDYLHFCRKIICIYLENKSVWKKGILGEVSLGKNKLEYNLIRFLK